MNKLSMRIVSGWISINIGHYDYFYDSKNKRFVVMENNYDTNSISKLNEERLKKIIPPVNYEILPNFAEPANLSCITITGKCNMNCPYCFVYPVPKMKNMSVSTAISAVKALKKQSDKHLTIYLWGGEPSLNPKALIAACNEGQKHERLSLILTSNGVFSDELFDKIIQVDNLIFQISFDGIKEQNNQKLLTNKNSLPIVLNRMKSINRLNKKIILRSTVTKNNISNILNGLGLIKDLTKTYMIEHVHTYVGRSQNQKTQEPNINDYGQVIMKLLYETEQFGINLLTPTLEGLRLSSPPKWGFINILPDKYLSVTNSIIDSSNPMFKLLSIGKLKRKKIVISLKKVKKMHDNYIRNVNIYCDNCIAKPICRGGIQRDLFCSQANITMFDDTRCKYYKSVLAQWILSIIPSINSCLKQEGLREGMILLKNNNKDKNFFPLLVHKNGLKVICDKSFICPH